MLQRSSDRGGVDPQGLPVGCEGFACLVAAGGAVGIALLHLADVGASWNSSGLKVRGDGPSMNPELASKLGERLSVLVVGDEPVDLRRVEVALNGAPNRFRRARCFTSVGWSVAGAGLDRRSWKLSNEVPVVTSGPTRFRSAP